MSTDNDHAETVQARAVIAFLLSVIEQLRTPTKGHPAP